MAFNSAHKRVCPVEVNVLQFRTSRKNPVFNAFYAARYPYGGKGRTPAEEIRSETCHPFLESNGFEGRASLKNTLSPLFYAARNFNGFQRVATGKSIRSNACQAAVRKVYLFKGRKVAESPVSDTCHPFLYRNVPETFTSLKNIFPPIFHIAPNDDG
ncbi:hypothetical protein Barb6_03221 [Bacteroidales bacterium Barb6]|nr:hypothetical protein Barb6_03221 [Bacteroidales bacterium Barb6]